MTRLQQWLIRRLLTWLRAPGVLLDTPKTSPVPAASGVRPIADEYAPDREYEELATRTVESPVSQFNAAYRSGQVKVAEAWLYEGRFDGRGRLMRESSNNLLPYRIRHIVGDEAFRTVISSGESEFSAVPGRVKAAEAAREKWRTGVARAKEAGLVEDSFGQDMDVDARYDSAQYTEYAPTYGGPFNKQLYLSDYLTMHARAFEAANHNPIARRIIDVISQYALGRRFKWTILDEAKLKAWEDFEQENNIVHKMCKFWCREFLTYGELMINKATLTSIDPSTVWDIITNPDEITDVYYYYQSYPTAFQTFTGFRVPGAPGSQEQKPIEYIIRQLPAQQVIHIKANCVSQEKRGRSILFPVLGWCKRIKDLYNAQVVRSQLQATFVWDDTITGNDADVQAHLARYAKLPVQPSVFAHNDKIKRQAMPAVSTGNGANDTIGGEILAFIATAVGIPKDFFNLVGTGVSGGSRATALVGAEPFEKVIQSVQAEFESLALDLAELAIRDAGLDYKPGDVEFTFPAVTKDTTTERIKNISLCETMGYFDHRMASEMSAVEMDVTRYDYDQTQQEIKDRQKEMPLSPVGSDTGMVGLFGPANSPALDGQIKRNESPIHGVGKADLKGQLKNI